MAVAASPPATDKPSSDSASAASSSATETKGQLVGPTHNAVMPAPANIRTFVPDESAIVSTVPADKLDLRRVFEDLGPDATLWYQHVQTLASPFFEGRAPGTRGGDLAGEYIAFSFKQAGVQPAFPDQSQSILGEPSALSGYFQPFDFESPSPDIKPLNTVVAINGQQLVSSTDFTVLGNSGNGGVTASITFVGYAIEHGKDDYSSFEENTDLSGRIAMVLRYEPLDEDGKSRWSSGRFTMNATIAPKMASLAKRNAAGIILVNPPGAADGKSGLESIRDSARFGKRMSVPVFQVTPDIAEQILKQADPDHRDLLAWRKLADAGEVKSVNLDDSVRVTLDASLDVKDRLETRNVAAVLRGKGKLADEWVVIGAHYDHLGYGYTGMMSQSNAGKLHPGADDNASGSAGVLITAKRLADEYAKAGDADLRSILFVTFSAEEAGLFGSQYLVEHLPMPKESISLMINMDMIGRLRGDKLLVQGASTADGLSDLLQPHYDSSGLKIFAMPGGSGPSDHSSFNREHIPVLFFFTGEHAEYHRPSDKAYTVNPAGAVKVLDLLEAVTMDVASRPGKLEYKRASAAGTTGAPPSPAPGRDTGAKVSLGTMPDYTAELETGMRVAEVRDGSPADLAGIKPGDILMTWNGQEIAGPRKLSEFLGKHEPGDKVKIVLQRGDREITVEATLQARAAQ